MADETIAVEVYDPQTNCHNLYGPFPEKDVATEWARGYLASLAQVDIVDLTITLRPLYGPD
jgi:hypothetical protein